jgi:hypothetical protein
MAGSWGIFFGSLYAGLSLKKQKTKSSADNSAGSWFCEGYRRLLARGRRLPLAAFARICDV